VVGFLGGVLLKLRSGGFSLVLDRYLIAFLEIPFSQITPLGFFKFEFRVFGGFQVFALNFNFRVKFGFSPEFGFSLQISIFV
jgi:hypothetical protein